MGDQIEAPKSKLSDFVNSKVAGIVLGKKLKLDGVVSLGKVFED